MTNFSGTVTFITGASSGIGHALAREIARKGGDVVLAARRQDRLLALAAEIETMGRRALGVVCDVSRDGDLEKAAAKAYEMFGRIDYVVANAGFGVAGRFEKLTMEDHRRQFETNVYGVLRTIQATRDHLIESRGCLAIVGSVNGYIATPRLSSYSMSKFAVHGLADSLRHELRPYGVGVLLIVPGYIATEVRKVDKQGIYRPEARDRVPKWLLMTPEKAARQIARALYKRKRIKMLTWFAVVIVALQRHFPNFIYLLMARFGAQGRQDKK